MNFIQNCIGYTSIIAVLDFFTLSNWLILFENNWPVPHNRTSSKALKVHWAKSRLQKSPTRPYKNDWIQKIERIQIRTIGRLMQLVAMYSLLEMLITVWSCRDEDWGPLSPARCPTRKVKWKKWAFKNFGNDMFD